MADRRLKIVITGGSGFIGQALAESLGDEHEIVIIDRNNGLSDKATYLTIPLESVNLKHFANTDVLVHLAWASAPATGFSYAQEFSENINPSKHIIETAVETGVKRIVFQSSAGAVYGNVSYPFIESGPTRPISAYGQAKLAVEEYLKETARTSNWVIARPTNVIGNLQKAKRGQGILPTVLHSFKTGQPLKIRGDAQKDYLAIDDLTSAMKHLITAPLVRGIFNIGSGQLLKTSQIISIIEKNLNIKIDCMKLPLSPFDIEKVEVDSTKIRQRFGWQPQTNIKNLIQKIVKQS